VNGELWKLKWHLQKKFNHRKHKWLLSKENWNQFSKFFHWTPWGLTIGRIIVNIRLTDFTQKPNEDNSICGISFTCCNHPLVGTERSAKNRVKIILKTFLSFSLQPLIFSFRFRFHFILPSSYYFHWKLLKAFKKRDLSQKNFIFFYFPFTVSISCLSLFFFFFDNIAKGFKIFLFG
jgi:hypothetical protein